MATKKVGSDIVALSKYSSEVKIQLAKTNMKTVRQTT